MTENLPEARVPLEVRRRSEKPETTAGNHAPATALNDAAKNDAAKEVEAGSAADVSAIALSDVAVSHLVGASGGQSSTRSRPQDANRASKRRAFWGDFAVRAGFVLLLLLLWHGLHWYLVTKTGRWSSALFRSPKEVGLWLWNGFGLSYLTHSFVPAPGDSMPHSLWQAIRQASYPPAILGSMRRLLEGYAIAVAIGFPLGLVVARWKLAEKTIGWMAVSLQSLPSICWVPLAMLWLGKTPEGPIFFVTIMGALFATVVAVADGIRQVPPLMSRAGRTLGAGGLRLYFGVLLPSALPGIVTGLKIAWSFAWRSLMAAEIIVNTVSLGNLLEIDRGNGDMEGVISTIIVIILIGLGTQALIFAPVERRLRALWGLGNAS